MQTNEQFKKRRKTVLGLAREFVKQGMSLGEAMDKAAAEMNAQSAKAKK